LLINKDRERSHAVRVAFHDSDRVGDRFFPGPVELITFGAAQYQWHAGGAGGYAAPDGPPVRVKVKAGAETEYVLPKASLSVIRGKVSSN
jgi:hypothetical protein